MEQLDRRMPTVTHVSRQRVAAPLAGIRLWGIVLTYGVVATSCSRQPGQTAPSYDYGYIVLGAGAAGPYGFVAGDTLGEIERRSAPVAVVDSAEQQAQRISYTSKCTRYFLKLSTYLVLFRSRCSGNELVEDGEAIAAFASDGKAVGPPLLSLSQDAYTALSPGERSVQ